MDIFVLGVVFLEEGVVPKNPLSLLSLFSGDCLYIQLGLEHL